MATRKQLAALRKARKAWKGMTPRPRGRRPTKKPYMPKRFRRKPRPGDYYKGRRPRPKPPDYDAMWKRKKDVFALNRAKAAYDRRLAIWKRRYPPRPRRR